MKMLSIKPTIYKFKTAEEFAAEFKIGVGDLVITNEYIYQPFFGKLNLGCDVLYQEKYGAGEPSDDMAEAMYKDIKGDHMAMPSTAAKGTISKIVPLIDEGAAVTTSRYDVNYVVTEYGIAQLKGKTLRERARELIKIAHPDFREGLIKVYEERFHAKF